MTLATTRIPGPFPPAARARPDSRGLARARLIASAGSGSAARLVVVAAPAGSGKTVLLSQLADSAASAGRRVGWLSLGHVEDDRAVLHRLRAACGDLASGLDDEWSSTAEAVHDLDQRLEASSLLVIDDLQVLAGRSSDVVQQLVNAQPARLDLAIGTRTLQTLDLVDRELRGSVLRLDADDLRFRTWEVEELFRRCYGVRLGPDEVMALTQRTTGWAAGLALFHLATQHMPPSRRRQIVSGNGGGRSRLTRTYLARHVLDSLRPDLRAFLIRTAVFARLTAARCDCLLGGDGSADRLSDLDGVGLFTEVDDASEPVTYRCHEVLRSHLLSELAADVGQAEAHDLHRRASRILWAEGAHVEALWASCLAGDWDGVQEMLATDGRTLASRPGRWLDALPESMRANEPWTVLALARRSLADGDIRGAMARYRSAMAIDPTLDAGRLAAQEARILEAWTEPSYGVVVDWVHLIRRAVDEPRSMARLDPSDLGERFATAVALLLRGELPAAADAFARTVDVPGLQPLAELAALLGRSVALLLGGSPEAVAAAEEAHHAAKLQGVPALERMTQAVQSLTDPGAGVAAGHLIRQCEDAHDVWGAAVLRLITALIADEAESAVGLGQLEAFFREHGVRGATAWAAALAALDRARSGSVRRRSDLDETLKECRAVGPFPYAVALTACAVAGGPSEAGSFTTAAELAQRGGCTWLFEKVAGLRLDQVAPAGAATATAGSTDGPTVRLHCLGAFEVYVDDRLVDLRDVRPIHRAVLRLLSLHAGSVVDSDTLIEQLWPGQTSARAQHNLHVAVSALRQLLEGARGPDHKPHVLLHHTGGYQLWLSRPQDSDLGAFRAGLRIADAARFDRDRAGEQLALEEALLSYTGDLFPGDQTTPEVLEERDRLRVAAASAHTRLARLHLQAGELDRAVLVAERGLAHHRYQDELWHVLVAALEGLDNPVAARSARAAYSQVLRELGLPAAAAPPVRG